LDLTPSLSKNAFVFVQCGHVLDDIRYMPSLLIKCLFFGIDKKENAIKSAKIGAIEYPKTFLLLTNKISNKNVYTPRQNVQGSGFILSCDAISSDSKTTIEAAVIVYSLLKNSPFSRDIITKPNAPAIPK